MGKRDKKNNTKKWITIVVLLMTIGVIIRLLLLPSFKLSSDSVEIEAGKTFNAKTYITNLKNVDIKDIKITENIDNKKTGEYNVSYSYKKIKKNLTVNVVDTVAPKLTPKADFSVYAGEDVTAEMLVDVEDISKCEVKINIKDPDTTAPVISGVKNVSINIGDTFDLEKGVTVTDDFDKEPSLTVDDKNLNTKVAGKYTIYYTATDKSGNKSSVKRTVTVVDPNAQITSPTTSSTTTSSTSSSNSKFNNSGVANQPYLVAVNRAMCTITVYGKDSEGNYTVPIKAMVCSVGRSGHETPTGRYNTTTRYEWRLMVDNSYGRYAIRINGGIMFHSVCYYTKNESNLEYEEYNKLGSPASLGCIRLCLTDIKWLYDNCPNGFPTVIYDDTTTPGPLGKPSSIKIDVNDVEKRGYDPTDWSPNSPWNK